MTRGIGQIALMLAVFSALITAASAYIAGATLNALLLRVTASVVLGGSAGLIMGSWIQIKLLQREDADVDATAGQTVDIEVSDAASGEAQWQPLQVTQISEEGARVFPNGNNANMSHEGGVAEKNHPGDKPVTS